jgi:hypothetical protein
MIRFVFLVLFTKSLASALAQNEPPLSGDYVCAYGCRLTDANPSIAIDGDTADCINGLGGIFHGRVLSKTSISCFNKTGVLSNDGVTLRWSDGVIWKRHLGPAP